MRHLTICLPGKQSTGFGKLVPLEVYGEGSDHYVVVMLYPDFPYSDERFVTSMEQECGNISWFVQEHFRAGIGSLKLQPSEEVPHGLRHLSRRLARAFSVDCVACRLDTLYRQDRITEEEYFTRLANRNRQPLTMLQPVPA